MSPRSSILWRPSVGQHIVHRMTPVVAIRQSILRATRDHVRQYPGAYGFLFGNVEKATLAGQCTVIDSWWEVPDADLRSASVQQFRDAWTTAGAIAARQRLEIAGWYHGHGLLGCTLSDRSVGCTLSERDIALHRSFFRHDWQCSLVIIPHERFPAGAFVLGDPGNRHEAATPAPFLEVLESTPHSTAGSVVSYVDWTNYTRDVAVNGEGKRVREVVVVAGAADAETKKAVESTEIIPEKAQPRTFQIGASSRRLWPKKSARSSGGSGMAEASDSHKKELQDPSASLTPEAPDSQAAEATDVVTDNVGIAASLLGGGAELKSEGADASRLSFVNEADAPPDHLPVPGALAESESAPTVVDGPELGLHTLEGPAEVAGASQVGPDMPTRAPREQPVPFVVSIPTIGLLAPARICLALPAGSTPVVAEGTPTGVAAASLAHLAMGPVTDASAKGAASCGTETAHSETLPLGLALPAGSAVGAPSLPPEQLRLEDFASGSRVGDRETASETEARMQGSAEARPTPTLRTSETWDDGADMWAAACDVSNEWMDNLLGADPYRDFEETVDPKREPVEVAKRSPIPSGPASGHGQDDHAADPRPEPRASLKAGAPPGGGRDESAAAAEKAAPSNELTAVEKAEPPGATPVTRTGQAVAAPQGPAASGETETVEESTDPKEASKSVDGNTHHQGDDERVVKQPPRNEPVSPHGTHAGNGARPSQGGPPANGQAPDPNGNAWDRHQGYGGGYYGPPPGRSQSGLPVPGQPPAIGYDAGAAAYMKMAAGHRLPPYPVYQPPTYTDGPWPQPYGSGGSSGGTPPASLSAYWEIIKDRRMTVLTIFLVVFLAGTIGSFMQTPMYRAAGTLEIRKQSGEVMPVEALFQPDRISGEYLETQYGILESRSLVRRVIANLGFVVGTPPDDATPVEMAAATEVEVDRFGGRMMVDPSRGSRLVDVYFEHEDPETAAAAVNGVIAAYIDMRVEAGRDAGDRLAGQVDSVRVQLAASEAMLRDYMRENDLMMVTSPEGDASNLVNQRLEALQAQITEAEAERYQMESRYTLVQRGEYGLLDSPVLQQLSIRISDLEAEYARLRATFTDNYPRTRQVKDQLDALQTQFGRERNRIASEIRNDYEAAVARQELLTTAFEDQRGLIDRLAEASAEYNRLRRDVESNQDLYAVLQQHRQEAGVSAALASNDISIIDLATPPRDPFRPTPRRAAVLSLILGLLLGIAGAFLREIMDDSVKTVAEVGSLVDVPVLAAIPTAGEDDVKLLSASSLGNFASNPLGGLRGGFREKKTSRVDPQGWYRIDRDNARQSALSEAFGGLRTSVLVSRPEGPPQVILMTSAQPREGKTTVSVNLGLSLSRLGRRVLLLDADTRRPAVHRALALDEGPGLVDYLMGRGPWRSMVHASVSPGLDVLPAGAPPDSPSELLASPAMAALIHEARSDYDFVIVDSPALLVNVPDTRIVAPLADGVVLVMRSGITPRESARRMLQEVPNPIGVVLNDLSGDQLPGYYRMEEPAGSQSAHSPGPAVLG